MNTIFLINWILCGIIPMLWLLCKNKFNMLRGLSTSGKHILMGMIIAFPMLLCAALLGPFFLVLFLFLNFIVHKMEEV